MEFAERAVRDLAPTASPWDELVGPFLRTEGLQARLGITRQAIAAKVARRRPLRMITSDGQHLYPLWQFGGDRLMDGLGKALDPGRCWSAPAGREVGAASFDARVELDVFSSIHPGAGTPRGGAENMTNGRRAPGARRPSRGGFL